jgi:putative transposase
MYPCSLTEDQFHFLEPLLKSNVESKTGRPRIHQIQSLMNAILYVLKTGCQWRMLPNDFPAWQTVYSFFRKLKMLGLWKSIMDGLRSLVRISEDKSPNPTAGIIDSRTNKAAIKYVNVDIGYDAGKKTKGRKQHIIVDTLGLPIAVQVHAADIQDRDGAKPLLTEVAEDEPTLKVIFADGGYAGKLVDWANEAFPFNLEIVKRSELHKFVSLRKRWIVERTFSWLVDHRRIARDYERDPKTSESMIQIAMIRLMLRRLI